MNIHKRLRDVIYGFINLDQQECEIIDRPEFQRLRRIKQLALTHMVYPGTMHTRFEHSIGVMQMASDMYDRILENSDDDILKACNLLAHEQKEHYRKTVRLAALLHDIGHPPFSHAGENLLPQIKGASKTKHEAYSVAIIRERFKDIIERNEYGSIKIEEVIALIDDKAALRIQPLGLLAQIISGQLDADRADYLLRDSHHAGVKYGVYDNKILINSLRIAKIENFVEKTHSYHIVVEEKGIFAAESFLIARYQMFMQVYRNKIRCAYNHHLELTCKSILSHGNKGYYPRPDQLDKYLEFDDVYMEAQFKRYEEEHGLRILERKHWKCLYSSYMDPNSDPKIKELIEKNHGLDNLKIDTDPKVWYAGKPIIIYDKTKNICQELHEKSNLVEALTKKTHQTHVFLIKS